MELKGISVIEVSGESCANCLTLLPVLNTLLKGRKDINFIHLEADEKNKEEVRSLKIEAVPTILVMKDEKEVARSRGFQPEEILSLWLDEKIQEAKSL